MRHLPARKRLRRLIALTLLAFAALELVRFPAASAETPPFLWASSGGGNSTDLGNAIAVDAEGNSYVTGEFYSSTARFGSTTLTNGPFFIAKFDSAGQPVWARQAIGSAKGYAIATDADGNSFVTGEFFNPIARFGDLTVTNSANNPSADIFVVKYDSSGNAQWARSAGAGGLLFVDDRGLGIALDGATNCFVTGLVRGPVIIGNDSLTNGGLFLAKYDSGGSALWAREAFGVDRGTAVAADAAGNSYVTGFFTTTNANFGPTNPLTNPGFFIAKYDSAGNVLWVRQTGTTNSGSAGYGIAVDAAGNSFVTGAFTSGNLFFGSVMVTNHSAGVSFSPDMFVASYDAAGDVRWARSGGGNTSDYGFAIAVDAAGGTYVTGFLQQGGTFDGIVLTNPSTPFAVKYDSAGNVLWAKQPTGEIGSQGGKGIAVDAKGDAHLTGDIAGVATFDGVALTADNFGDILVAKIGLPPVGLFIVGDQIVLSWSTNVAGFVLESAPELSAGTNWTPETNAAVVGDHYTATNDTIVERKFYRLRKP
jgi:hypothetical protein